jgi:hypothetical protein
VPPAKEPLYKSKYPPTIKPTGSTFCNHTTSKPLVPLAPRRLPTSAESSPSVSRPTPSTATPRLSVISREIANRSPTAS